MTKKVHFNHRKKTILVTDRLTPVQFHGWMLKKLQTDYPNYTLTEAYKND